MIYFKMWRLYHWCHYSLDE